MLIICSALGRRVLLIDLIVFCFGRVPFVRSFVAGLLRAVMKRATALSSSLPSLPQPNSALPLPAVLPACTGLGNSHATPEALTCQCAIN